MCRDLVSIIIPIYNRAHLIGETLDSVLAQTYANWECIIVDDGSTDGTVKVLNNYSAKDTRFQLYHRSVDKPKGANSCRNIGLENAIGKYVVFFDSDDIMTPNHIQVKISVIEKNELDYVITRTKFFNTDLDYINKYYQFDKYEITPYNYVSQIINWLTYDIIIKTDLAKCIQFNEDLHSGQEYNYFSKLVHYSCNAIFVNKIVTLRRYHEDSIRSRLKKNNKVQESYFAVNWLTYLDLKDIADNKTLKILLERCVLLVYENKIFFISNKFLFCYEMFKIYKIKTIYFIAMYSSLKLFNKGYYFRSKLLK